MCFTGWNTNTTITQPTPTGVTTTIGGATSHTPVPSPPPVNYMCYGSWGSCASDTNCHLVTWYYNYQVQSIMINITAAVGSDKWLGIGFNHQKKMVRFSLIILRLFIFYFTYCHV